MANTPTGYAVTNLDTEGTVAGNVNTNAQTAQVASVKDTAGQMGGPPSSTYIPPAVAQVDTSGTNGVNTPANFHPVNTSVANPVDTMYPSIGGTPVTNNAYQKTNPTGAPVNVKDTTRTDVQPGGSYANTANPGSAVPSSYQVSANVDTWMIGSPAYGGPQAPAGAVPAAPAAPTAVAQPGGQVRVSWTAAQASDNVTSYVIVNSAGGTIYAGKNATSAVDQHVQAPGQYTYRIYARNRAGNGPMSPASTPVTAIN